uniref:hypothetical protein n=1 Tax=Roseivirga sp. TaxID=1964215 RepID=UPI0040476C72
MIILTQTFAIIRKTVSIAIPDGSEPAPWFHEIFQQDGTPYKQEEVDVIKELTGKK